MVRQRLSTFAFYRFRYAFAYVGFALALATMLFVAGFYLPGGLAASEINSALISDALDPNKLFSLPPDQLIYLPYRLLQAASIAIFGLSTISIKLPSIILGFISALGILYLLNLWYRRSVAIIVATIAVTMSQFLLSSQAGQAGIVYIFLTTTVLVAASMITRRNAYAQIWLIAGFILAGISLYMPLNLYMLVALFLTAAFHPHARHLLLREASKYTIIAGSIIFLVIISPLVIGAINDPSILLVLLGVSESITHFGSNAATLAANYIGFSKPASGAIITPVYGLGMAMLILLGLYRLISAKYTTKSYIISIWLVLLIPLVCLNPDFVSITFIPVMLLVALAVDYLVTSWYGLFPHNPYARVFGLMPLGVLLIGLVVSNIDRYSYGLHYDRAVYSSYSYDINILAGKLKQLDKNQTVQLIVTKKNLALYQSFAVHQRYVKQVNVSADTSTLAAADTAIVERDLKPAIQKVPTGILVTRTADKADRFYLYKNK